MSLLQKINTGGWDQNIVEELKLRVRASAPEGMLDLMHAVVLRIEETLDHDDLNMTIENLNEKINELEVEVDAACNNAENGWKTVTALKADAAIIDGLLEQARNTRGLHKVT